MDSGYQTLMSKIPILISIFFISAASGDKPPHYDWTPLKNVTDLDVVNLGMFAVTTHNSQAHTSLVFDRVVYSMMKVRTDICGTDYKLIISVRDGTGQGTDRFEAIVHRGIKRIHIQSIKLYIHSTKKTTPISIYFY
ncbi:putative Cystatin domain-containing protein [Helianthus anomalus]